MLCISGAIMNSDTSTQLFAYWNDIRGSRIAPHRFEIEPARIADILAETFVLERDQENTFRFRLAGTHVCDQFGREFRGHDILDMWTGEDRISFERVLRSVAFEGAVGVVSMDASSASGKTTPYEILLLPLVHAGTAITRILGSMSVEDTPPAWLASVPLVSQKIRRVTMIWPDGRPHAVLQRSERQHPFSPLPQHKRVLSINQRSFRVFEGGLSERAPGATRAIDLDDG